MLSLTHLVVQTRRGYFLVLSQTLPLFVSLETLCLESSADPKAVVFPELHLDTLPGLRSVTLKGLAPGSIRLSKSCKLHVDSKGRLTEIRSVMHTINIRVGSALQYCECCSAIMRSFRGSPGSKGVIHSQMRQPWCLPIGTPSLQICAA